MSEWIKCSERMPERYVNVLIAANDPKEVIIAYLNRYGEFCFDRDSCGDEETCTATHWQLLPSLPLE